MWFGVRRRTEASMQAALGDDYQAHSVLRSVWLAVQTLFLCTIGVFFLIGIGIWTLLVSPFYWAWHRMRGKPLPAPNYDLNDVA